MRVQGPNSAAIAAPANGTRRASGSGFTLDAGQSAQSNASVANLRTIGGIDALVALQAYEDPTERRRRAVKSGRSALDMLDEIKVGLIGGDLNPAALNRLKAAATHLKGPSGDAGLDAVLAEIELRVEVEIAKLSPR